MAQKKLKLLYLAQFLQENSDEQHPRTIQDIQAHLRQYGIEAERKSLYDDLHLLEEFGLDIQTKKAQHFGYYIGDRSFQLAELKTLIDVVQASPFLSEKKSMDLIKKLTQLTSRYNAGQLNRQVYVLGRPRTLNEQLYYAVDGIYTAIQENRKISFRYFDWTTEGKKALRKDGALYTASPVALCVDRHYYLIAYDPQLADYRHYRVDRILQLTVTDQPRDELPQNFDLAAYVKTVFDMYNGETRMVQLRFEQQLLNAVIDRFGADAHMHQADSGYFHLTAPVEVGPTFFGWLAQFGKQAQILGPQQVQEDFLSHCRQMLAQYE
ncbi:MAG: WYL domain-containing protein [Ruminococcaceae bacterium]|nr:WYL domain-containing protein [Oscillospiraceae bacterium]